jgi:hypothetical protein
MPVFWPAGSLPQFATGVVGAGGVTVPGGGVVGVGGVWVVPPGGVVGVTAPVPAPLPGDPLPCGPSGMSHAQTKAATTVKKRTNVELCFDMSFGDYKECANASRGRVSPGFQSLWP